TRRIQRATYLLSIEDGVTKRNKNGKVLGCGTHPNMESFHHPRAGLAAWDAGSAGNYYSAGTDPDGDGIGDTHHPIPGGGGSVDNYPLMHPWTAASQRGDLNGDDQITRADAVIVLAFAAGGSASCDPATLATADVSGDNRATPLDALMILQAAAGRIEL
ncbi:MAG: dockerin type I domain-containing protein, partial [Euryarchaeota archaeon]|nr:dockerin type I domain-containing protein [Euryarchaeota archaeon]